MFGSPTYNSWGSISLFRPPFTGTVVIGWTGADVYIPGTSGGGSSLGAVLAAGDVDGDGQDDLVAGAPYASGLHTFSGSVYVFPGPVTNSASLATAPIRIDGPIGQKLGQTVDLVGDLDGDGARDLAVHDYYGTVHLLPTPLAAGVWDVADVEVGQVLPTFDNQMYPDGTVTSADLDGDGVDELVVGEIFANGTYASTGAVYAVP